MYVQIGAGILIALVGSFYLDRRFLPWEWREFFPTVTAYLIVAFGIYLGIGFVAVCIYLAWYFYFGRLIAPVKTVRARVYFKTDHRHSIEVPERLQYSPMWEKIQKVIARFLPGPAGSTVESFDYIVEFQLGQGKIEEFAVPEEVYGSLSVGDEGVLTYRGTKLISFRTSGVMME